MVTDGAPPSSTRRGSLPTVHRAAAAAAQAQAVARRGVLEELSQLRGPALLPLRSFQSTGSGLAGGSVY